MALDQTFRAYEMHPAASIVARRQSSSRRYKILRYNTPSVILDRSFSSPKRDYDSLTTIG